MDVALNYYYESLSNIIRMQKFQHAHWLRTHQLRKQCRKLKLRGES